MTQTIDETRLGEFMGQMIGHMTGGALCFGIWLGDELGLYRVLAGADALTSTEVADSAGCNPRLVREWLDGQVAGGLVGHDATDDRYWLSPEAAMALADDNSPVFVARAMNAFGSMFMDIDKIAAAFRGDGALSWGDHHPCLFSGTEWFFRTGYRAELPSWIAALDGVEAQLESGARVADVAAATEHRSWCSRTPTRTHGCTASTSTPLPSRLPKRALTRRVLPTARRSRSPTPRATAARST
jgi:hypothetical protein